MKACVFKTPGEIVVEERPVPEIGDREVLIKINGCGTCLSELPDFLSGKERGRIPGHEGVGIVERVGKSVGKLKRGDRVAGLFQQAFAEYAAAEEEMLVKIPETLKDEAVLLEPWSCLVSGIVRAGVLLGKTVAVIGCGYMGLGAVQLAVLCGAASVIGVDSRIEAAEIARLYGACESWLPGKVPEKYIVDTWNEEMWEKGIDVVIEATGKQAGLDLAGRMAKPHGVLSVVGYHHDAKPRTINMELWNWKAITVINAHERRRHKQIEYMKDVLALIERNRIETLKMVTHFYTVEEIEKAFWDMQKKPDNYIKGYVRIN